MRDGSGVKGTLSYKDPPEDGLGNDGALGLCASGYSSSVLLPHLSQDQDQKLKDNKGKQNKTK